MKLTIFIVSLLAMSAVVGAIVIGNMSFDGVVTEDPFETGLIWDEIQKNKAESGITIRLKTNQYEKGTNRIEFQIEKSRPIDIDLITIVRSRPSTTDLDKQVTVTTLSENNYQAEMDFPLVGNWDLIAKIDAGGKQILFSNRIYVRE